MILKIENLAKSYDREVLEECNLRIENPTIYGLVGENGAGKTTLMKCIWGLQQFENGTIDLFEQGNVRQYPEILKEIGGVIEVPEFYDHLTAKENLTLHLEYMNQNVTGKWINESLISVGLTNVANKKVGEFSLGMKQRLAIARAIVHKPKLLLLDEPINALSPKAVLEMRDLFLKLKEEMQMTLIISSHNLHELKQVADVIGVLANGSIQQEFLASEMEEIADFEGKLLALM